MAACWEWCWADALLRPPVRGGREGGGVRRAAMKLRAGSCMMMQRHVQAEARLPAAHEGGSRARLVNGVGQGSRAGPLAHAG